MPVTQDGRVYAFQPNNIGGMLPTQDRLTLAPDTSYAVSSTGTTDYNALSGMEPAANKPNYLWYMFGIFILLVALKFATEHEKADMDPQFIGIGVWNWIAVTLLALLGLVTTKVVLNKYPVKGLTDIVNFV